MSDSGSRSAAGEQIGFLGLGSNVGDRRTQLQAAVGGLVARGVSILASSSVYETEPVGDVLDQPPFFNACLRVGTALTPGELLDAGKAVERELGRRPAGVRHGPRPIDVDLLLLGREQVRTTRLQLPHPEVGVRRFVLVPLLELAPGLCLPDGTALAEALAQLGEGQSVRWAGPALDVR